MRGKRAHEDSEVARPAGPGGGRAETTHGLLGIRIRDGAVLPWRQRTPDALGDTHTHRGAARSLPRSARPAIRALRSLKPAPHPARYVGSVYTRRALPDWIISAIRSRSRPLMAS